MLYGYVLKNQLSNQYDVGILLYHTDAEAGVLMQEALKAYNRRKDEVTLYRVCSFDSDTGLCTPEKSPVPVPWDNRRLMEQPAEQIPVEENLQEMANIK